MNITKQMAETIIIALSVAEFESQISFESAKEIVAEILKVYPDLYEKDFSKSNTTCS